MKEVTTVYRTEDLSIFKTLLGNRAVKENRKQALIESIDKHGYITNPIIVNERYEVIDGQGRLAACKELNSPIDYIIVPNISIDECRILNMNMKNWMVIDFIKSYAEKGNKDYQRLLEFSKMGFNIRSYMFANSLYGGSPLSEQLLKEGRAKCSYETYTKAKQALEFLKTVKPFTDAVDGRKTDLESAVLFAYYDKNCDNERVVYALTKNYNNIGNIISLSSAMDELSKIYNRNLKGLSRIYLREDWDRLKH